MNLNANPVYIAPYYTSLRDSSLKYYTTQCDTTYVHVQEEAKLQ